jgi:hypothetical protein
METTHRRKRITPPVLLTDWTLGRGWQKLLALAEGFRIAVELDHEM